MKKIFVVLVLLTWLACAGLFAKETIVTPSGGEVYVPGTTQEVRLSKKVVRIEISVDGGATWDTLGTPVKKVLHWVVPSVESNDCKVRVLGRKGYEESFSFSIGNPTGSQGPAGETGPQGPMGIQGPAGADGEDGVCHDGNCGRCSRCVPGHIFRHGVDCGPRGDHNGDGHPDNGIGSGNE